MLSVLGVVCAWCCLCLVLSVLGVVCAWCCCYDLCGCVNGASPVRFVLPLFYLCAFQMNQLCVVCVVIFDRGLLLVYLFVTR